MGIRSLIESNLGSKHVNPLEYVNLIFHNYPVLRLIVSFSFAATGAQLPKFSSTWLGWNSLVIGAILKGEVYEPPPVSGARVVSRHTPTTAQGSRWLKYMLGTRLGLQDVYSVARHNCRTFSQWEFGDAPSHW